MTSTQFDVNRLILPLQLHFELNDLVFFYKIIYKLIPVTLPSYISPYTGDSRLRKAHMDSMSFVINITPLSHLIMCIATANFLNHIFTEHCTFGINCL